MVDSELSRHKATDDLPPSGKAKIVTETLLQRAVKEIVGRINTPYTNRQLGSNIARICLPNRV